MQTLNTSGGNVRTKLKKVFRDMIVYKEPKRAQFFSSIGVPSYLRDWVVMHFSDDEGRIDYGAVGEYVNRYIPRREHWELIKARMRAGERVRFLTKLRAEIDVKTGKALYSLPDLGFPKTRFEAVIDESVLRSHDQYILGEREPWGIVELAWAFGDRSSTNGVIKMVDFEPFCPYEVSLDYYKVAAREFTLEEWIDVLLMAIDYNPAGFLSTEDKIALLSRLLPFVEKRLNLIELAPKGTGKSYVFSNISKYGWLVSGGSISRAKLFYDLNKRTVGIIARNDYVALDEIQSIKFSDEGEIQGALKGYMESGEYRIGDYRGIGEAGIILLGNIDYEVMHEDINMFAELPKVFHESALIDRFHGFVKGWEIPRMKESMKAQGWALNTEYFSEILHQLRSETTHRALVDQLLNVPKGADTRDTEAIKRISTGFLKLLFPYVSTLRDIDPALFVQYCLEPAKKMRGTIRKQLHAIDREYGELIPEIGVNVQ